jgi:transposase
MKKEDLKKLLNLGETIDVFKVEEKIEKGLMIKFVHVKSNKKKARCTKCFTFSNKVHDYLKPSKITYLKNSGSNTYLIVYKRRFECKKCNKSFTEDLEISNKGCKISNKTKQMILKQCLERDKTIKSIAEENNISEDIVRTTFLEAMKNYPSNVELLPSVISFDEVATHTRAGLYSFVLNDPIHKITLDILKTRKKEYLIEYFSKVKNRYSVKVVICDLYKPYYEVVKICFPNAIFVADPFHYTRYIEEGLDKVRIRLMHQYEIDKKSYEYKMLKNRNNRKLLLRSFNETKGEKKKREEQTKKYEQGIIKNKPKDKFNDYWYGKMKIKKNNKFIEIYRIDRLQELLDINETLVDAYTLKEDFFRITINVKYKNVKEELKEWINKCNDSNIPEMIEAASTINNWLNEIVNSFKDDKYSNGFTEANNNTIGKIIDRGYGYKNFEFFRLRALAILHKSYSNDIRKNSKNDEFRNGIFFKNN